MASISKSKSYQRIVEAYVVTDRLSTPLPLNLVLRVGWRIASLCDDGPRGPVEELVSLEDQEGVQVFASRVRLARPNKRTVYEILQDAKEALLQESGLYPRIAALHPRFSMTGLSAPDGGWIDGEAYHILDPVVTIDADAPGTKREGGT